MVLAFEILEHISGPPAAGYPILEVYRILHIPEVSVVHLGPSMAMSPPIE